MAADKSQRAAYFRSLGKRVRALRQMHEMTQAELARRLGVSQQAVFAYELGDHRVPVDVLEKLAKLFRMHMEQILNTEPCSAPPACRLSPRLSRHVETLKQLSRTEIRFVLRLTEVVAGPRVLKPAADVRASSSSRVRG